VREVLNTEDLDVEFATPGHLALITSVERWDKVRQEANQTANSPRPIKALDRQACEDLLRLRIGDHFLGGRWFALGSVLNPVRLVHGLAAVAQRQGARFVAGVRLVRIGERDRSSMWEVETERGIVRANHLVLACGAALTDFIPALGPVLEPIRGQVLATEPLSPLFAMAMAVDWGTVYWRQTQEGVIILGGFRTLDSATETGRDERLNPVIQEALTAFLPQAFPGFPPVRVSHRWAGIMDCTVDGRPVIGAVPGFDRQWVIAGFGGHGLPVGIGAGKALAEAILTGRTPLLLQRYDPVRFFKGC
jgi:gamma-glutamylputrescine oxidase